MISYYLITRIGYTVAVICLFHLPLQAVDFGLNPTRGCDTVSFQSSAKLEFIEGKTTVIKGGFSCNPDNLADSVYGIIQVDLRTLKTGIATRDRHMRTRHLHTDTYPFAWFQLQHISGLPQRLNVDTVYSGIAAGLFYLHGNVHLIKPEIFVTRSNTTELSTSLHITAHFAIHLEDYDIPRPKMLFLKLAETIEVTVVLTGESGVESDIDPLPAWKISE